MEDTKHGVRSDKTTRGISVETFSEVLNHGFRQSKTDSSLTATFILNGYLMYRVAFVNETLH